MNYGVRLDIETLVAFAFAKAPKLAAYWFGTAGFLVRKTNETAEGQV